MMRVFFILLFFPWTCIAQLGVMNVYHYPAKEDLLNLNVAPCILKNNQVYTLPYMTGLYKITNTGEKVLPDFKDITLRQLFSLSNGTIVASGPLGLYLIKQDKLIKQFPVLYQPMVVKDPNSDMILFSTWNGKQTTLYALKDSFINSLDSFDIHIQNMYITHDHHKVATSYEKGMIKLFEFDHNKFQLYDSVKLPYNFTYFDIRLIPTKDSLVLVVSNSETQFDIYTISHGILHLIEKDIFYGVLNENRFAKKINEDIFQLICLDHTQANLVNSENSMTGYFMHNDAYHQFYLSSNNTMTKGFEYIKKYPSVFEKNNAKAIFSLSEDLHGLIWAGSYNGYVAQLNPKTQTVNSIKTDFLVMNGSLSLQDQVYFIKERGLARGSIASYNSACKQHDLNNTSKITGFYLFKSRAHKIYFGTLNGLWFSDEKSFYQGKPNWLKIDTNQLDKLHNILTITEDTLGRIWYAHPKYGIGIYDTLSNKTQYFIRPKNEISFGAMASITDNKGTVWFGAHPGGLWYYNRYDKNIKSDDFKKIIHPFFDNDVKITALCLKEHFLIINANDKTLVLDLDSFYQQKINVKYLTVQESAYTSATEQNTLLTAKDSSIWFSTNDMLYQWNFNAWLKLPKLKAPLSVTLSTKNRLDTLNLEKTNIIAPDENSLQFELNYITPDLLPRYLITAIQFDQDSINWSKPTTTTQYNFTNLKSGNYTLHIKILELDGTTSYYQYKFCVDSFWFQKWWILTLIGIALLGFVVYLINLSNQKKLALQTLLTERAKTESVKAALQKELTQLQANSISNQFRPHFLLNALNQIGSFIDDNPKAESILSRLGENVDIVFSHSQTHSNVHPLFKELKMVENIVAIHKSIYLPDLEYKIEGLEHIQQIKSLEIPFGIFQIPVENALLHGLNNKASGPYLLHIQFAALDTYYQFTILDNGVGRKQSALKSTFQQHGTGLKNIKKLIELLNKNNPLPIQFEFIDNIFIENNTQFGTKLIIQIPKLFVYDFQ
ncbi:MAG: histidine kinase [Chitinophagaceae bacterium]|nr:histidine kinase [Chitinophagaceae bacterium]